MLHRSKHRNFQMFTSSSGLDMLGSWMRLGSAFSQMSMSASEVIFHRSMKIGLGNMSAPEAVAMMMEKPAAFAIAAEKAGLAAARGANPVAIATAALTPIGHKTRANARKLRG
jgi:hypothetical protein